MAFVSTPDAVGRTCLACGVGINGKRAHAIYCSTACKRWATRQRQRYPDRYVKPGRKPTTSHKRLTYGTDAAFADLLRNDVCAYCGEPGGSIDHIEPVAMGGVNGWENLTGACRHCNYGKQDQPVLMFLLRRAGRS